MKIEHERQESDAFGNQPRQSDREKLQEYADAMDEEGKAGARELAERARGDARRPRSSGGA